MRQARRGTSEGNESILRQKEPKEMSGREQESKREANLLVDLNPKP